MDDKYKLNGISFIWDQAKARSNPAKHGVTFERAAETFFDPFLRLLDAGPEDDVRDAIIGMDENWNLLYVVHLVVENEQIRIISARKATRNERRQYED